MQILFSFFCYFVVINIILVDVFTFYNVTQKKTKQLYYIKYIQELYCLEYLFQMSSLNVCSLSVALNEKGTYILYYIKKTSYNNEVGT